MKKLLIMVSALVLTLSMSSMMGVHASTSPVFSVSQDEYEYNIGDDVPVWVSLVEVTDVEDGTIVPVVDSSDFDETSPGWYNIVYTATDSNSNVTVHIMKVHVVCKLDCSLVELTNVATDVPGVVTSGISSISKALIGSAIVIFPVGVALVFKGFKLVPRTIKSLRK